MMFLSWKGICPERLETLHDRFYDLLNRSGAVTRNATWRDAVVLSPAKFVEAFRSNTDFRDALFRGLPPGQAGAVYVDHPLKHSYAILYKWGNNHHSCYEGEVPTLMWRNTALLPWMLLLEPPQSGGEDEYRLKFGVEHLATQPPPTTVAEFLAEARDMRSSSPHTLDAVTAFRMGVFLLSHSGDLSVCYDYVRDTPSLCQLAPLQYLLPNPQ